MKIFFLLLGKLFGFLFLLLFFVAIVTLKPLDTRPYKETEYYQKEIEEFKHREVLSGLESLLVNFVTPIVQSYQRVNSIPPDTFSSKQQKLQIGWSKVNILPPFTTPIAIDADRHGKHWSKVHDSIYVRAFVFKKGYTKVAYISADLLIIPPIVVSKIDSILSKSGFSSQNIYYTATHTHTSIGAWHPSIIGELFAGKFDNRIPTHLANCFAKAILNAEKKCSEAKVGYTEISTHNLVVNRLVGKAGKIDDKVRIIKIQKATGDCAVISTFAAHATCLHKGTMEISGDWPSALMSKLEKSGKLDFACYSAGAVGSQGPYEAKKNKWEEVDYMASSLSNLILNKIDSIVVTDTVSLNFIHLPLHLREPNIRVIDFCVLRPWVFNLLFGKQEVYANLLEIGSVKLIGMPCDFSGELSFDLCHATETQNKHLVITSFNGGYIGYVTSDKWYNKKSYETWTMNWFGPENGTYFKEVIRSLIVLK